MSQDTPQNFRPQDFHLTHPVLNFAGTDLHIIPHMCANLEPMSQDTPQNLRPQDFNLTHPCFELCRSRSPYYTPHVCQPILNNVPRHTTKPQTPRFSSHTSLFRTLPEQISNFLLYPTRVPTLNQCPKTHHKTSDPKISSHNPCFELCRNRSRISILYPTCVPTHLEPMSQDTPQNLRPQDLHLTHPFLNFAGADLHSIPHMCANPS